MWNPFKAKVTTYTCHYVVMHFPTAEGAAGFILTLDSKHKDRARLLQSGEKIPLCRADVDAPFSAPQW